MNHELARRHMIEQQLRPWEVLDATVVDALYADRREDFVLPALRDLAFAETALPLSPNNPDPAAVMLSPGLEAHCLQALGLKPADRVLEIGTGSGHMAALLAMLAHEVWSIEIDGEQAERAQHHLQQAGVVNVTVEIGDGLCGLPDHAPFDAILLSGAVTEIPTVLIDQLARHGRLVAFVASPDRNPVMTLRRITRNDDGPCSSEDLIDTRVPYLRQAATSRFAF